MAHPDDETFGCGSTLLAASAAGAETFVVCATRGEAGEPAPGSGVSVQELGPARERELQEAASLMGVSRVELLEYRDSGMDGAAPASALVSAGPDQVVADVVRVIEGVRPHVVVTLDAMDGHRDHVVMRDAVMVAVERASWRVQRVYLQCLARSAMRAWADHMKAVYPDSPYLDVEGAGLGTPDEDITTVMDVAEHLPRRWDAIRAHASQTSPFEVLPEDVAELFLSVNHLRRVVPAWEGGPRETDFLDGLVPDD